MSYGPNVQDFYLRTAVQVHKILKGARARDLPVLLPTQFELVLNQRSAAALNLELAPALLSAAHEIMR